MRQTTITSRRAEFFGTTIRRLLRRGARSKISKLLGRERMGDVAMGLGRLTPGEQLRVFQILIDDDPAGASEVLLDLEPDSRNSIIETLKAEQVSQMLKQAAVDDAVAIVESVPDALKERILEIVDLDDKLTDVQTQLTYPENSAGRIMDTDFVALEQTVSVGEAVEQVRRIASEVDMISYLYVVDKETHLLGVTSLRQLLLAQPEKPLSEIMNSSLIRAQTDTDQEEVAQLAARYDLLAIPVTNTHNQLVGIVTVDDIVDIFADEATEDFYKLAGTSDDEMVYQDNSMRVAGIRLPWLLVNLVGLLMAGVLTARFDDTFQLAILVGFIPVVMGMAGNIGSQTSTITVRGLATGRLSFGQGEIRSFLWQQLKVGAILATICGLVVGTVALIWSSATSMSLVVAVAVSLFLTVQLASLTGTMIPVLFSRIGVDPAVASGPLVTTTNDIMGILIYFGLAFLMLDIVPF